VSPSNKGRLKLPLDMHQRQSEQKGWFLTYPQHERHPKGEHTKPMGRSSPDNESSRPKTTFWAPPVVFALVMGVITLFNWSHLDATPYTSDQIGIGTLLLKYEDPMLFPAEQGLRPLDLYPKAYLGLLNILVLATGEIKEAFFLLGTFLLIAFAVGMYVLLYDSTGNPWMAAVLAVASLWFRASFGGHHWQSCSFDAFLPRLITLAMVPWLLLACSHWLGQWKLTAVFAALGVAANYHPLSALFLATIFGLTLLLVPGARVRHIAILAVSVLIFSTAAAPYFLEANRALRAEAARRASEGPTPTPEQIEQARQATAYAVFPPPWKTIRWVSFYLALPALVGACGLWLRRRRLNDCHRTVVAFLGGVVLVAIGGQAAETVLRHAFGIHKSFTLLRAFHLVYLPLWIFSGWLIEGLWRERRGWQRLAATVLAVALLTPVSGPEYIVRWLKYGGNVPQRPSLEQDPDFVAVCQWALAQTDPADTFVVPPTWSLFPFLARRTMVAAAKEASFIIYDPAQGVEVYERCRNVREAYEDPSSQRLIEVAKRYGARYILVHDRELPGKPVFQSRSYRVYTSK